MSNGVCIICYENARYTVKTYRKKSVKLCDCDYYIHEYCLNEWMKYDKSCPICKCKIGESSKLMGNALVIFITNMKVTVCIIFICIGLIFGISILLAILIISFEMIMQCLLIRNYA